MKFRIAVAAPKYWYIPCNYHLFISYILCQKKCRFSVSSFLIAYSLMVVLLCLLYWLMQVYWLY